MSKFLMSAQDEGFGALLISICRNVDPDTAFKRLSKAVMKPSNFHKTPSNMKSWTNDDLQKVLLLRAAGIEWSVIGKAFGTSTDAVRIAFKRFMNRERSNWDDDDMRFIMRLRDKKVGWDEIADIFDTTPAAAKMAFKRFKDRVASETKSEALVS